MDPDGHDDDTHEFGDWAIKNYQGLDGDSCDIEGVSQTDHEENIEDLFGIDVLFYCYFEHLEKSDSSVIW